MAIRWAITSTTSMASLWVLARRSPVVTDRIICRPSTNRLPRRRRERVLAQRPSPPRLALPGHSDERLSASEGPGCDPCGRGSLMRRPGHLREMEVVGGKERKMLYALERRGSSLRRVAVRACGRS